jgi:hypothetical protein
VRGVAAPLQKAAGDAARARGLTLGQWLSGVVEAAVADQPEAAAATGWRAGIDARFDALEARLGRLEAALAETANGHARRAAAPARRAAATKAASPAA